MLPILERCKPRRLYIVVLSYYSEVPSDRYSEEPLLLWSEPIYATYDRVRAENYTPFLTGQDTGHISWRVVEMWGPGIAEMEHEIMKAEKEWSDNEKNIQ